MKPISFFTLALFIPLAAYAAEPVTAGKDTPLQLDKFDVTADKENHFSLPLDAVATSGSRLGLTSRELPASVSIITQEMMQLRACALRSRPSSLPSA